MKNNKNLPDPVRRAALYIRVSTEEQARKGYSLPAQKEDLDAYAKRHGYAIVDYYIDDGISARKKYTRRKDLMRLLGDVEAGKIDVILFIKLDRWFRNVADYYAIQSILEAHHVTWRATHEDYETETSQGQLYVNIMLSIAQNESDRTSDRIKFVFASKVARGEAISARLPTGLKIENKHIVPDTETADMARALFQHYRKHKSVTGAMLHIRDTYGILLLQDTVRKMLKNPLYKGQYRDNSAYCEPLIPPEEFDEIQDMLKSRSIRRNPTSRVYIFSGLIFCQECKHSMAGCYVACRDMEMHYYRCEEAVCHYRCVHRKRIREDKLEEWLILHVVPELDRWQAEWECQAAKVARPKAERASILRKLERLKNLYVNEFITMDEYLAGYRKYSAQLEEIKEAPPIPDFAGIRRQLTENLTETYHTWEPTQRRDFWRNILSAVHLNVDNIPRIYFK